MSLLCLIIMYSYVVLEIVQLMDDKKLRNCLGGKSGGFCMFWSLKLIVSCDFNRWLQLRRFLTLLQNIFVCLLVQLKHS